MDIKALAERHAAWIVDRRRWYHAHPELSGKEEGTRAAIAADLRAMGVDDIHMMERCFGLTADICGGAPGKCVALRTDIDALEVIEETGLSFAATNGAMHACGHDAHIAMLLGAAKILNEIKGELRGRVRLLVQPAEEVAAGAPAMMAEGAMDGVDAVYGAHVWGNFDAPLFDVSAGSRMACCDRFTITIEGTSAHASAPHLGVDAIAVASSIVGALQQCVSRMTDPLAPVVLTIGTIQGGSRWNVIPNRVTMEGTVRSFDKDMEMATAMRRVVEDGASALGAKGTLDYRRLAQPVINEDERLIRIARDAVTKLYGPQSIGQLPTMMASEDFGCYGEKAPYLFAFIGSRNASKGITWTNHHEKYDIDEDILARGAAVMAQFAVEFLAEA
ncbi:MAG: amidohydrolase [Synergistaceae bacterium]|nr:amidohydrolase [Synergistaceae bacterium]